MKLWKNCATIDTFSIFIWSFKATDM